MQGVVVIHYGLIQRTNDFENHSKGAIHPLVFSEAAFFIPPCWQKLRPDGAVMPIRPIAIQPLPQDASASSPMSKDLKIDYVEFPAQDFDAVEKFYSESFGWKFTDYGPEYRAFNDGKLDGGFYKSPLKSSAANGSALVILYAADLEATREKVIACGGKIATDIFTFPGGRRFQFLDPSGNELGVWSDK